MCLAKDFLRGNHRPLRDHRGETHTHSHKHANWRWLCESTPENHKRAIMSAGQRKRLQRAACQSQPTTAAIMPTAVPTHRQSHFTTTPTRLTTCKTSRSAPNYNRRCQLHDTDPAADPRTTTGHNARAAARAPRCKSNIQPCP